MDYLQPPQTPDTPPRPTPQSPSRVTPKTPIDRGRRPPRLVLPSPNSPQFINNPSPYPASLTSKSSNPNGNPYMYPRKHSEFVTDLKGFAKSGLGIGEKCTYWLYNKLSILSKRWFTHCFLSIVLALYTVGGAAIFVVTEGSSEQVRLLDTRKARYDLIEFLRNASLNSQRKTSDGEWEGIVSVKIKEYGDTVLEAYKRELFIEANDDGKLWSFFNSVVYCTTIYTTIGYGHIFPTTTTGQALTIVYAIIGIPLFLIALTDFGKLFTRCIKFFWSFVRRVYYTGSCRRVRKTAHVEDILQGAQMMYEIATLRRPSMFVANPEDDPENPKAKDGRSINSTTIGTETPTTPAPSNFEIDDEFNLPITVAIIILVVYIFLGAMMYCYLEGWDFFAAFYFVFISMSTIGFGDYVPKNKICMIASIVYLVFGLALMSMCINVVQVKLSDTFKDASSKLGATIGLNVNDDDGSISTVAPTPVEVPEVHISEEQNGKDKKNDKKKDKKSSLKVSKPKEENEGEDEEYKPPKEVKF